jgi:precorrin-6A/cobalt-precorrin-6A reductase
MIALILGTTEGKKILSLLNKFTDDIFVSTATNYGGELLNNFKFKVLNTKPLDEDGFEREMIRYGINVVIDASHPYAVEVTKNLIKVCSKLKIEYIRYERPSILAEFSNTESIKKVRKYEELGQALQGFEGCILNTTGSRNIEKIMDLKLKNRIVHRVLPTVDSVQACISNGVKIDDIIAIKGPVSFELNKTFIKEYDTKLMLLKDSGIEGGTLEKLRACMELGVTAFVIERDSTVGCDVTYSPEEAVGRALNIISRRKP